MTVVVAVAAAVGLGVVVGRASQSAGQVEVVAVVAILHGTVARWASMVASPRRLAGRISGGAGRESTSPSSGLEDSGEAGEEATSAMSEARQKREAKKKKKLRQLHEWRA